MEVADNAKANIEHNLNASVEDEAVIVLAAEVRRLQDSRKWRPIETAPKDRTEVLLFNANEEPSVYAGFYEPDGGYWSYSESLIQDIVGESPATHWMPLPELPE